jgi:hypothetical protein
MRLSIFISVLMLVCSCQVNYTRTEVGNQLKQTMQAYLYNQINNDSANVQYHVKEVIFFEDEKQYICEFTVNLKEKLFDTTGIMKATISKDYKQVKRIF